MGAQSFIERCDAASASEAFSRLVSEDNYERGHDSYSGGINTCSLTGESFRMKKSDEYHAPEEMKKREVAACDYIRKNGYGYKWECSYIDLGIVGWRVTTVISQQAKEKVSPKYRMSYVVLRGESKIVGSYPTKTAADKAAVQYALKNLENSRLDTLRICKMPALVEGKNELSSHWIEDEVVYKKPRSAKPNQKIEEIHRYVFYGLAAC